MSYAARLSLWVYRQGADLSKACDEDAARLCSANASAVSLSKEEKEAAIVPGVYGQCLVDHQADAKNGLSAECAKLVAVVGQAGSHVGGKVDNARLEEALQMLAKVRRSVLISHYPQSRSSLSISLPPVLCKGARQVR